MSKEFIPITKIENPPEEFKNKKKELEENIINKNIPNWLLLPGRANGEHATQNAWTGVLMAKCSEAKNNGKKTAIINARIAWDTENRHKSKSIPSDVPEELKETIVKTAEEIKDVEYCCAKIKYDAENMIFKDLTIGHVVDVIDTKPKN